MDNIRLNSVALTNSAIENQLRMDVVHFDENRQKEELPIRNSLVSFVPLSGYIAIASCKLR